MPLVFFSSFAVAQSSDDNGNQVNHIQYVISLFFFFLLSLMLMLSECFSLCKYCMRATVLGQFID